MLLSVLKRLLTRQPSVRKRVLTAAEPLEARLLLTRLAVIGDYSSNLQAQPTADVAALVQSWSPDAVVTAGDNNYPNGAASTIDGNIGRYYQQYISPYTGSYGSGSADGQNHFWPTLGNHDYTSSGNPNPYLNYFTLPNNERYYTTTIGNIALFVVNSESEEPDGITSTSTQAAWIQNQMQASTATWKIVVFHEPFYASGGLTNSSMNWPFKTWGATAVISGHDHEYERLSEGGLPYFIDGLGGESIDSFQSTVAGSQVRYNGDYGAMRIDSTSSAITFSFVTRTGTVIDTLTVGTPVPNPPTNLNAVASPGQIALSWGASAGATGYKVYRGTSPGGESATPYASNVSGTTFTDTGVTTGVTYYYTVSALNAAGESAKSVEASASLSPPATPTNIVVYGGITQIALSWGASAGAGSYNIYRGTSAGGESPAPFVTNITSTTFTDTSLSAGATFFYTISAVNGLGESAKSTEVSATVMTAPAHVVVVVESHYNTTTMIGESATSDPYINSLADSGALFILAKGVTYPGQPNYLALFSGSTQSVTSDVVPSSQFSTANLGSQLIAAGRTFTGYAEDLPSAGSLVNSSGSYIRYHNPWSEFSNVPGADNQPFTSFPTNFDNLPTVSFVVPNLVDDMHGEGSIAQADSWLQTNLGAYAAWAQTHNSLLVVTWDDNDSGSDPANPIATIITGQSVQPGSYTDVVDHYGLLRTLEDLYGLTRLGSASSAITIQDAWHAVPQGPPAPTSLQATSGGTQQISLTWSASAGATGYNVYRGTTAGGESATPVATNLASPSFNNTGLSPGVTYYYQVTAVNASGESGRSAESSATTTKASPTFNGLLSPTITYGAATTTLTGTIAAGTLIPTGTVSITVNGTTLTPAINPATGAFSAAFDTHALSASATAYAVTYAYAGSSGFNAVNDTTHTLTVNTRALHVTATGINRAYDGTTTATVTLGDDRVNADTLTVAYGAAAFADKNVGTGKTVSVTGITVTGAAAGNYTLALTTATTTANITARALAVSAAGVNRIYDATTAATVTLSDNRIAGDVLTTAYTSAAFATKAVGTGKTVSVSGISITGTDAANYTVNTTATTTANITARSLTVTAAGVSRVYDGTTAATVTLSDNRVAGDVVTDASTSAAFADKNVGLGKGVNVAGISISGADAGNYSLANTTAATTANITVRALTVTASGTNKVYDGTTTATVTLADNRVAGDVLTASNTSATFADKNVGTAKPVSVTGISIAGTDASNYSLTATTAAATANITARSLTVTAAGVNKIYDRTIAATVTLSDNRIAGDVLTTTNSSATFADKNVGNAKAVSVTGISISGADAGNYTANTTASTTGNITARSLTVTASGINKIYDGATTATVTLADNRIAGDVLTDVNTSASFADKVVGAGKTVSVAGISISGADAGNYALTATTTATTASITARSLTVTAAGVNRVYDGTTTATVTLSDNRVAGDVFTASNSAATFADKNVGTGKAVSVSGIAIAGADAGNYSLTSTTAATTANITVRSLTATATGVNKVYDRTTAATVTFADNRLAGDTLLVNSTPATFADKNVGTAKPITVTGINLTGADSANYALTSTTAAATADITARVLTVGATGTNKTYDGTPTATVTLTDNRVAGDSLSPADSSAAFVDKNIGAGKTVNVNGITISGADAANYSLGNTTASTTANITARSLAVTATGVNKVYDGASAATVTLADNRVAGDVLTASYATAAFADKNVGIARTISVSGISISGADAANYAANVSTTATADVTARSLTVSASGVNRVYDGTPAATVTLSDNRVAGDVLSDSYGSAAFADKNVGDAKPVAVSLITIGGADAANYALANTNAATTANIAQRALAVTATAASKSYDGTTAASVTLSDNRLAGDVLTLSFDSANFADKNAGTHKTVTITGIALAGPDSANYDLPDITSAASATADITALSIPGNVTVSSKIYDGGTTATLLTRTLTGAIGGDAVSLTGGSATFDTKIVGVSKTVTATGLTLSGADAGNYSLSSTTATTTADITALSITGSVAASNKVYDGTIAATVLSRSLIGVLGADDVTLSGGVATFDTKNVGDGKTVTVGGLILSGADAGNYTLAGTTATAAASVTPLGIGGNITASGKVYDGTVAATLATRTLTGVLGTDVVTLTGGSASFDTKNVGIGKTVTATGLALGGADSGNYTLSSTTATTTADVTQLSITGNVTASSKVYDGTAPATLLTRTLSGVLGSDAVNLTGGSASFDTKSAGVGKTVTATGLTLGGADAGNYLLSSGTATTTADITPLAIAGSVTAQSKAYDGTTSASLLTRTLSGVLGTDVVNLTGGTATFDTKNVGTGKTVTAIGLTLSGADAGNYVLTSGTATTTADVTPELAIAGTGGDDAITLILDASGQHIDWFLNGSSAFGQLLIGDLSGLTITSNGGDDAVTLDNTNGNPLPNYLHLSGGTFTITGLQGASPLANTTLEIGRSTVFVAYANVGADPIASIKAAIQGGFNNGAWTGVPTGSMGAITSLAAKNNASHNTAIGYADFGDGSGVNTTSNTVMLKYAVVGDTDLNGTVGLSDYTAVVRNFGVGTIWTQGAVTYGSAVSLSDYTAVVRNFGTSVSGLAAPAVTAAATTSAASTSSTASAPVAPVVTATTTVTPAVVAPVQPAAASTAGSTANSAATVVDSVQGESRGKRRLANNQAGGNRRRG